MKISDTNIVGAIKELKVPYYCKKCKTQHKTGTKVWTEHLQFIDASKVSKVVRNRAVVIAKQAERGIRKSMTRWARRDRSKILENYKKLLKKVRPARYYYWEANAAYVYQLGSNEGYNTLEELMRDQKFCIDRAKKGESVGIIMKATPYKIIKARETGRQEK